MSCSVADGRLPSMLVAAVSSTEDLVSSFSSVEGAAVDYSCGVVSRDKAVVFAGPGRRAIETIDVNMTASRYCTHPIPIDIAYVRLIIIMIIIIIYRDFRRVQHIGSPTSPVLESREAIRSAENSGKR